MRVESISKNQPKVFQTTILHRPTPLYSSSLQRFPRKKRTFLVKNFFEASLNKIRNVIHWMDSKISKKSEAPETLYSKIKGNGEYKYRLNEGRRRKEKAIKFSKQFVHLEEILFPKGKKSYRDMRKMLLNIMEKESLDSIHTANWAKAYKLHCCGLETKSLIQFNPNSRDVLNQQILTILKEAYRQKNHLAPVGKRSLIRLEEAMVRSIVTETLTCESGNSPQQLHQAFSHSKDDLMKKYFQADFAKAKIDKLEEILGHSIDLKTLTKRINTTSKKDDYFQKALKQIKAAKKSQNKPQIESVEFPIAELFCLMKLLNISANKKAIQNLPNVVFTK